LKSLRVRGRSKDSNTGRKGRNTSKVRDITPRIAAPHGLSHHERDLLTEGLNHMQRREQPAVFISIEAGREPGSERIVRDLTRRIRSDVAQRQRRSRMRRVISIAVFESLGRDEQPKFGAHIVAVMPNATARDKLIASLNRSKVYNGHIDAGPVWNWRTLPGYLLKESTPQAWYGARKSFRRIKGSRPLGELGGDRVIPSRDLRDSLIRAGRIEPYRRTYARRLPKAAAPSAENVVIAQFGVCRSPGEPASRLAEVA
jgi:hypothetical protein